MGGIKRGLQLIADFLKLFVWAVQQKNLAAIADCMKLADVWLKEAQVASDGAVKLNPILLLFSDPFEGSRKEMQRLSALYGKH